MKSILVVAAARTGVIKFGFATTGLRLMFSAFAVVVGVVLYRHCEVQVVGKSYRQVHVYRSDDIEVVSSGGRVPVLGELFPSSGKVQVHGGGTGQGR